MSTMEAAGVGLGTVSLFFQIYDSCKRLYSGYDTLRHFGKDMHLLHSRLRVIEWDLDTLMETRTSDLRKPPNLDNRNHPVTKEILVHLSIILTYFKACNKVIAVTSKDSGWMFSEDDGTVSPTTTSSPTPSLISQGCTLDSVSSAATPADSLAPPTKAKHSKIRKILRDLSPNRITRKQRTSSQSSGSSLAPTQTTTQTSTSTGSRSVQIPERKLEIPKIMVEGAPVAAMSMQDETSRQLRAEASWWTLIKWADHNKDALETEINRLSGSVTAFRQYLELREPRSPGHVLAVDTAAAKASYVPRMPPAAVQQLHSAIKSTNQGPLKTAEFSVSIADTCESNRRAIEDVPGIDGSLRPESVMFFLQKEGRDGESTFVAIEQSDGPPTDSQAVPVVTQAGSIVASGQSDPSSDYASCGIINPVGVCTSYHRVFVESQAWQVSQSFSEYLEKEDFRRLLTPSALVSTFKTVLIAYLDLGKIRDSCRYPRLEDYKTYTQPGDGQNTAISDPEAGWQMPYWSCGLGAPLPRRKPGASREDREPDENVVKLGLVLFQLGSGSKSIMAPGQSRSIKPWRNLKLEALNKFEEVSRVCGLVLANIVQACLLANAQTEYEAVCSCLVSLENLQTDLNS